MREILFRSWNEFDKKFIYFKEGLYNSDINFKEGASPSYYFKWGNAEQFTGLLDKNGNKIFEGDKINDEVVKFEDGMFGLTDGYYFTPFEFMNVKELEVVYDKN